MTREEILALSGRKLDAAVAEHFLGWSGVPELARPFSTDWHAAGLVLMELHWRFTNVSLHAGNGWGLTVWAGGNGRDVVGPVNCATGPEAIARTALLTTLPAESR